MIPVWLGLLMVVVVAVTSTVPVLHIERGRLSDKVDVVLAARQKEFDAASEAAEQRFLDSHRKSLRGLLSETRSGRPRFEVRVDDWGPEHEPADMRWRWTAWDAERHLLARLHPDRDVTIGTEFPLMLGNAPTKVSAMRDGVLWVLENGADVVVLAEHEGVS